jgi:hypothetical protein
MAEPRELTVGEREAMDRLEKALASVPDTLVLYFNESGIHVFDPADWLDADNSLKVEELHIDHRRIRCRYDTGAL